MREGFYEDEEAETSETSDDLEEEDADWGSGEER